MTFVLVSEYIIGPIDLITYTKSIAIIYLFE